MSFDEIFDLTAGVYFNFYNIYIARSTYHYAYARQTQVNWRKETRKTQ